MTLNFGIAKSDGKPNIVRSDWSLSATENGIAGEVSVVLYQPLETCDPIAAPESCEAEPFGSLSLVGSRVTLGGM